MPRLTRPGPSTIYGVAAVLLLAAYCGAAVFLWRNQDFGGSGPLAETNPALTAPLPAALDLKTALERCYTRSERFGDDTYKRSLAALSAAGPTTPATT